MARTEPTAANVLDTYASFPRFSQLEKGERARVLLLEFGKKEPGKPYGPWTEFVHSLQAEEVKEDGRTIRDRKFWGTFICPGDVDKLQADFVDPAGCPLCAMADEAEAFRPMRYHATNIIRYATKQGTFDIREPQYYVECLAWRFAESRFREIAALHDLHGDLQAHDLLVECTEKNFQKYNLVIDPGPAAWIDPKYNTRGGGKDPYDLQALVVKCWKEDRLHDEQLQQVVGEKRAPDYLMQKANELIAYAGLSVNRGGIGGLPPLSGVLPATAASTPADIADLLASGAPTPPSAEATADGSTAAPAEASAPVAPPAPVSLDDILNS